MGQENSYFALNKNKRLKYLFLLFFAVVIGFLLFIFKHYLWPFLFALLLYMPLRPINDRLKKKVKFESISSFLIIMGLFLLILVPTFFLFLALADQTFQLYKYVQQQINSGLMTDLQNSELVQTIITKLDLQINDIVKKAAELIQKTAGSAFSSITAIVSFPISFSINFLFMVLMLFFLLKDGYRLDKVVYETLPFPDDIEKTIIFRLKEVVKVLLAGNVFIMTLQGLVVGVGFFFAGLRMPLLWGSIAAILSLIPVIGTTFIWIPAVLYLIIVKQYVIALVLSIWCLVGYLLLENLVKPVVFGEKLNFHPIVFFFLLLGSLEAFGLPGVILGPIFLTLFYSFWEIYKLLDEYDLGRKMIEKTCNGSSNNSPDN